MRLLKQQGKESDRRMGIIPRRGLPYLSLLFWTPSIGGAS